MRNFVYSKQEDGFRYAWLDSSRIFFSVSKTWKPVQKYSLLGPDPDIMREIPLVWGDANLGHRWPSMALTFIVKRGMIKGYVPHIFCIIFFLCCLVVTFKGNTWKCTTHGGNENRADLHHLLFFTSSVAVQVLDGFSKSLVISTPTHMTFARGDCFCFFKTTIHPGRIKSKGRKSYYVQIVHRRDSISSGKWTWDLWKCWRWWCFTALEHCQS